MLMTFSIRLKELRNSKKLTQEQIANELNIKRSTYAKYETGENQPDHDTLQNLADFFNVSVDYLLGRTNKKEFHETNQTEYDSLVEINKIIEELGIDSIGFFDVEKWKNLSPEDVEEIKKHFEWVAHKAKQRNKKK